MEEELKAPFSPDEYYGKVEQDPYFSNNIM